MKHRFGPVICLILAVGLVVFAFTKGVEREQTMCGVSEAATDGEKQDATDAKPVFLRGRRLNVPPIGTTGIQARRVHIK